MFFVIFVSNLQLWVNYSLQEFLHLLPYLLWEMCVMYDLFIER
jgi:hypothetical protein